MSTNLYQPIKIIVSNAQPGQNISTVLSANNAPVAWSTGPEFSGSAGIQVTTQTGDLPLQSFYVTTSDIKFSTSSQSGGSALAFTLSGYLVGAPGIDTFYLKSNSDPGIDVMVQIGSAQPQTINQTNTLFQWS